MNRIESPGRNGKTTSPVSAKMTEEQQRVEPGPVLRGELRERLVEREQRVEERGQHRACADGDCRRCQGRIFSAPAAPRFLSGLTRSSRDTPSHITSGAITSTDE